MVNKVEKTSTIELIALVGIMQSSSTGFQVMLRLDDKMIWLHGFSFTFTTSSLRE